MKVSMKTDKQFFGMSQNAVLTGTNQTETNVLDSHRTFLNDTFGDPNFHTTVSIQNIDLETGEKRFEPISRLQSLVSPRFDRNKDERCVVFTTTPLGHPDIKSEIRSANILDADEATLGKILRSTAENAKSHLPKSMRSKPSTFAVPVPRQQGNRGLFALAIKINNLFKKGPEIISRIARRG